jgi:hypothetical protein
LSILDVSGKVVQSFGSVELMNGTLTISLSELKSGIYFVALVIGDRRLVRRFVKK